MSVKYSLAHSLRAGQPVVTAWSLLSVPMIPELLARSGFEAVTLDLQHGMYGFEPACEAIASLVLAGAHRIVRIPVADNAMASRLVDMGAECVIAPMINSADKAREFVDAIKYPPQGERSWSPFRAAMLNRQSSDGYLEQANDQTIALAMIETKEAVEALDDILAVEHLDGVFVGPSDLSLSLSNGLALDPNGAETSKVCAEIAAKTLAAGKIAGIFCLNAEKVREAHEQGYRLMSHGIDTSFVDHSARAALKEIDWLSKQEAGDQVNY